MILLFYFSIKIAAAGRGSSVGKLSWNRALKRGATELTRVQFPVKAKEVGKILATPSMRRT